MSSSFYSRTHFGLTQIENGLINRYPWSIILVQQALSLIRCQIIYVIFNQIYPDQQNISNSFAQFQQSLDFDSTLAHTFFLFLLRSITNFIFQNT